MSETTLECLEWLTCATCGEKTDELFSSTRKLENWLRCQLPPLYKREAPKQKKGPPATALV